MRVTVPLRVCDLGLEVHLPAIGLYKKRKKKKKKKGVCS